MDIKENINMNKVNFIAQHRRGSVIFFPLICLLASIVPIVEIIKGTEYLIIAIIVTIGFLLIGFGIFMLSLFSLFHIVEITNDEIVLKGINGIVKKLKISDITRIIYKTGYGRSNVPFLIIEDRLSENNYPNSIFNKKGEFIKIDFNLKRLKIFQSLWQGKIIDLPQKYQ